MNPPFSTIAPRPVELLAPARDADCGIEAIRHGADAVYIGGPGHGARAAACNATDEIARLCEFAHPFKAKVYVTMNTILRDAELAEAEDMAWQLYRAGVDAFIVQDLAFLKMRMPPVALHASTQMDNCTVQKAQWLEAAGFRQIVLAREASLEQIRAIAQSVDVPLEAFVHGALCVSYSGRCYASEYCFGRSANRGRCAQFCRLAFDLVDGNGRTRIKDRHLLSLRDMNRTDHLEEMMDVGITSFKIEGRLKDQEYVKNVTAWYRQRIDDIIARRPESFCRSSFGQSRVSFRPDPSRTFNRLFTDYYLQGRGQVSPHAFYSPKATGAEVGEVSALGRNCIVVRTRAGLPSPVVAGDGLCFIGSDGKLQGFRVNRVEGEKIYPAAFPSLLQKGCILWRNQDHAFSKMQARATARRTLKASLRIRETDEGYAVDMSDETGCAVTKAFACKHETARTPQKEAIERQLSKLGDTIFEAESVEVAMPDRHFIPASQLAEWRRQVCEEMMRDHRMCPPRCLPGKPDSERLRQLMPERLDFTANVANGKAEAFCKEHGAQSVEPAFELRQPHRQSALMTCRYCLRFALGRCPREGASRQGEWPEPWALRLPDGRLFPLRFDCANCQMQVLTPHSGEKKLSAE